MLQEQTQLNEQLQAFARRWLGRELGEEEQAKLAAFVASLDAGTYPQTAQAPSPSAQAIETEKQRVQAVIQQTLRGAQDAMQQGAQSQRSGEQAVLDAVAGARTLDDLRPSTLRPSQSGDTPVNQLLIAQIADRLANMVKAEVQSCFERQLAPLANRIEAMLNEAHTNAPPAASDTRDASQNSSDVADS